MGFIVVFLIYIGGGIAWVSHDTGTCTGNVADQLNLILLSFPLYIVAAICFAFIRERWEAKLTFSAVLPVVLWQAGFAIWFSFQVLFLNATACDVLFGAPYGADGSEVRYVVQWLSAGLGLPVFLVWRLLR